MTHKGGNLRWWVATVVGTLGVCLGMALGLWQLDRAEQKMRAQAAVHVQSNAQPLDAGAVQDALVLHGHIPSEWLHRPVTLQGQWMPAHAVYLDNRQMQARPGFFVLTPLKLDSGAVVMVQRGWIARNFQDRSAVQAVETPSGTVVIEGHLAGSPARLYALGDEAALDAAHPHIRQNLEITAFAQATGLPLWPVTVVQTGAASEGLLRQWPQPGSCIATHQGYAFQWFAIAAVLAGMLLWFQFLRPARTVRQRHAASTH